MTKKRGVFWKSEEGKITKSFRRQMENLGELATYKHPAAKIRQAPPMIIKAIDQIIREA